MPQQQIPEKQKGKSRFPFRRGDSSRSFQEVDSPPAGQSLTPVASNEPEPPFQSPQPQYAREDYMARETNGLMAPDVSNDFPTTNGSNITDRPVSNTIAQSQYQQPLPQACLTRPICEARLIVCPDTSRAQCIPTVSFITFGSIRPSLSACRRHYPGSRRGSSFQCVGSNAYGDLLKRLTGCREYEENLRNLKIRDQPIAEDETEAQQAMNNMANQLRLVCTNLKFWKRPLI